MQLDQEAELDPRELIFLDRAIPDALAYYRFLNLEPDKKLLDVLKKVNYRQVFILDPLPFVRDYARTEDSAAQAKLHSLLNEVYRSLGLEVLGIPVAAADERVDRILAAVMA